MKKVSVKSFDGLILNCYVWDNIKIKQPKGIIQVIHGMQEYGKRYEVFGKNLNDAGYIVFVSDLRGHGLTASKIEDLGKSDGDIFNETVQDQIVISEFINNYYKDVPLYIYGHSYGSFISQKYIQVSTFAKKVILSGTTNGDNFIMKMGRIVAAFTSLKGKHARAKLIEKMSFKSYAKGFEKGNWLSRDNDIWLEYLKDDYCGSPFPVSFYKSLFKNMAKLNKGIKNIPNDLQILFIAGSEDPVGEKTKQVLKLNNLYKKHNIQTQLKIYQGGRHEMHNEINKDEVFKDIIEFYNSK